jgi:hypothetical protein
MPHWVSGLIAGYPALERIARGHSLALPARLEQGLGLLPLDDTNLPALLGLEDVRTDEIAEAEDDGEAFEYLTPALIIWCIEASRDARLLYFETQYFGGSGGQGAAVFDAGEAIFGPGMRQGAISDALRLLGASAQGRFDAFDRVGLGRCRSNDGWRDQARHA